MGKGVFNGFARISVPPVVPPLINIRDIPAPESFTAVNGRQNAMIPAVSRQKCAADVDRTEEKQCCGDGFEKNSLPVSLPRKEQRDVH